MNDDDDNDEEDQTGRNLGRASGPIILVNELNYINFPKLF